MICKFETMEQFYTALEQDGGLSRKDMDSVIDIFSSHSMNPRLLQSLDLQMLQGIGITKLGVQIAIKNALRII